MCFLWSYNLTQETVMAIRHPQNKNLVLTTESDMHGLPLLANHGPYIENYLDGILKLVNGFVEKHRRATAIRFDLRVPVHFSGQESRIITKFFDSLKGRLDSDQLRNARNGRRVRSSDMAYIWVREKSTSIHHHYHCCVLVNGDAYYHLGTFKRDKCVNDGKANMANRVIYSWAGALRMRWEDAYGLVHFPANGVYHLNANSDEFIWQLGRLFKRLSYFAKLDTKHYGDSKKNFGSSRKWSVR